MDYEDLEGLDTREFWDIEIGTFPYRTARGVMYGKPSKYTVNARIWFPRMEEHAGLRVADKFRLTANCGKGDKMRRIPGVVQDVIEHEDGSRTVEVILTRKSKTS